MLMLSRWDFGLVGLQKIGVERQGQVVKLPLGQLCEKKGVYGRGELASWRWAMVRGPAEGK